MCTHGIGQPRAKFSSLGEELIRKLTRHEQDTLAVLLMDSRHSTYHAMRRKSLNDRTDYAWQIDELMAYQAETDEIIAAVGGEVPW